MRRRLRREPRPGGGDEGSIALLVITFTAIAIVMIWVAVDASIVFLARQRLASATDGAALSASQQLNDAGYFTGGCVPSLPLSGEAVDAVLARYETGGIALGAATTTVAGGPGVQVDGVLVVDLPSVPLFTVDAWTVRYTARARSSISGAACP